MSAVGLSIISEKSEAENTATEKLLDQSERVSELATWARALQDGAEKCLWFTSRYINLDDGGKVEIKVTAVDPDAVKAVPGELPNQPPPPANQPPERVM